MKTDYEKLSEKELMIEQLKCFLRMEEKMPDSRKPQTTELGVIEDSDLCRQLGVSRWVTFDLRKEGKLRYAKIGKRIFYKISDIVDMFNEHFKRE